MDGRVFVLRFILIFERIAENFEISWNFDMSLNFEISHDPNSKPRHRKAVF